MITDRFGSLMEELGKLMKTKLVPDKNNACLMMFKSGLKLQIELDASSERVMLASELGELPSGRYRENIFREALKANGLPPPHVGLFAFSKKKENLVIFDMLDLRDLTAGALFDFIVPFMQKAELWRSTISRGEVPSFMGNELSFGQKSSSGMFGLK